MTPATVVAPPSAIVGQPFTLAHDGKIIDQDGHATEYTATVQAVWPFSGVCAPVDNPPTLHVMSVGRAIPVEFSLGGDRGLAIFAAGASSVSYDGASGQYTDQYTYTWKTDNAWAGTCRRLTVTLADGTSRAAPSQFRR